MKWARHTSLLWELHEQELSKLSDVRKEKEMENAKRLAIITKQLSEERDRGSTLAAQERETGAARLRAAQEVTKNQ